MNASGVRHFFVLEAGEYVERLDSLLGSAGTEAPDSDALLRVARALRGAATMARLDSMSELAGVVEGVARGAAEGTVAWNPELVAELSATTADLRQLIGHAREWSDADDTRARSRAASLSALVPAGVAGGGRPPGVASSHRASTPTGALAASGGVLHLVGGTGELAAALTALLGRSNDEGLLDDARRRVAALRGVAAVSDHAELGALLDALDTGLRGVNVPLAGSTHATLSNAARMLRVASDDIRAGRNITSDAEWQAVVDGLGRMGERSDDRVVPIRQLFHEDEGPHVVEAAEQPATTPLSRFRMESAGQAENLRRIIASAREGGQSGDAVGSRIEAALLSLRDVALSYGENELARLIATGAEAAAAADRLTLDAIDALAARLLAEAGSVEELCDRLTDLARGHRLAAMIGHGFNEVGGRATPRSFTPRSLTAIVAGEGAPDAHAEEKLPVITRENEAQLDAGAAEAGGAADATVAGGASGAAEATARGTTEPTAATEPDPVDIRTLMHTPHDGTRAASRRTVTPTGADLHAFLADGLIGLQKLEDEPLGPPAEIEDQIVSVESLLYDRAGALQRARELRQTLLQSGEPASRETLEEIFDLLELATRG